MWSVIFSYRDKKMTEPNEKNINQKKISPPRAWTFASVSLHPSHPPPPSSLILSSLFSSCCPHRWATTPSLLCYLLLAPSWSLSLCPPTPSTVYHPLSLPFYHCTSLFTSPSLHAAVWAPPLPLTLPHQMNDPVDTILSPLSLSVHHFPALFFTVDSFKLPSVLLVSSSLSLSVILNWSRFLFQLIHKSFCSVCVCSFCTSLMRGKL